VKLLVPALLVGLVLPFGSQAMLKAGPNTAGPGAHHRLKAAAPALPGDIAPFTVFWGLRAYSSAQCTGSTQAVRLRRASDNLEADIPIETDCFVSVPAATAHCAATSCFVAKAYALAGALACGGASCDVVQATPANQPSWVFNCNGTPRPCIQSANSTTILLASVNNFTPAGTVISLHYVGSRAVGTVGSPVVGSAGTVTGSRLNFTSANLIALTGAASGLTQRAAADGAYHVVTGVVNSASSALYVDGGGQTGTAVGNTTAGLPSFCRGQAAVTIQCVEGGIIDAVALTQAQAEALNAGARSAYGIP
jgi:hypothetical protein